MTRFLTYIKRKWVEWFFCPRCRKKWAGDTLHFDCCADCFIELEVEADKMERQRKAVLEEKAIQQKKEQEAHKHAMMVSAVKQAMREIIQGDKP